MLPPLNEPTATPSPAEAAARQIRDFCGWHVAPPITETLALDGNGQERLLLPSRRVLEVEELTVDGERLTEGRDFRFSERGWITRARGVWPHRERCIHITMLHGFDPSEALARVEASIAARARAQPGGNIVSQSAGTQRVTFGTSNGEVTAFPLMQSEKEILASYRLNWGP